MRFFIAAILALFAVLPAAAQNQLSGPADSVITSVSPAELVSILQEAELNTVYLEEVDGVHFVQVSEDGASAYFALRMCSGTGTIARCGVIEAFGYFSAAGVTYAQLNEFNLNQSTISMTGLGPDGTGIIATKIYALAGVTKNHLLFSLGLYFTDLDSLISSIIPGTLAKVSYEAGKPGPKTAIKGAVPWAVGRRSAGRKWDVNAVGANAPTITNGYFAEILARPRTVTP